MDEMKMEESGEAEERDLNGQEEVIDEKKKRKPLFPLPIVFGAGIAMLLIVAAVFAGQANLGSQLKTQTEATVTPEVSETPDPSGMPPCPGVDPNNPPTLRPSTMSSNEPLSNRPSESLEETEDPTPPECREANCWTNIKGTLQPFPGQQECIPTKPAYCKGREGGEDKVTIKYCKFVGPPSVDNCPKEGISAERTNYNNICSRSELTEGCPPVRDIYARLTARGCEACWVWYHGEKDPRCAATGSYFVTSTDECEYVPEVAGQDGYRVDKSTCGYNPARSAPLSACYQSCQVTHLEADNNCEPQPLHPGECRLVKDEPPSDTPLPPSFSPSGVPVV